MAKKKLEALVATQMAKAIYEAGKTLDKRMIDEEKMSINDNLESYDRDILNSLRNLCTAMHVLTTRPGLEKAHQSDILRTCAREWEVISDLHPKRQTRKSCLKVSSSIHDIRTFLIKRLGPIKDKDYDSEGPE